MIPPGLAALAWPAARLGDSLTALARHSGLTSITVETMNPFRLGSATNAGEWIESAARRLSCEAEAIESNYRDLEADLAFTFPALLRLSDELYLAIVSSRRQKVRVLAPNLQVRTIAIREVCRVLREPLERATRPEYDHLLADAGISKSRRNTTVSMLLAEQLGDKRFDQCWLLRPGPGAGMVRSLRKVGAIRNGIGLVAAHMAQYFLWLVSWIVLGRVSLEGRMDRGWLLAWALLLMTLVPFRVLTTWKQGLLAIGLGGLFKRRLLCGALRLGAEEMRHCGIGSFLGQTFEAELVETFALSGGIASLLAVIELAVSTLILGRLAFLLLAWAALALFLGWQFLRRYRAWTGARIDMTHEMVESMVGHRTRLAQLPRSQWHETEDQALDNYLRVSGSLDHIGTVLMAATPRGWLIAALACLAPAIVAGQSSGTQTVVSLGGILLAFTAFQRLVSSFTDIAGAAVVWERISPLFRAAARPDALGQSLSDENTSQPPEKVVEADRLTFRYRKEGNPALQGCRLAIRKGDRVLLEGPSGGGKTTFASLLSGMRQPESGLLLAGGLDQHTLGTERWRKCVASAPQFHENHVLTETLAFNLLMGRRWPPTAADMEEAELLCRDLGLGPLLDTMPSGILQMVGEGGWQLSHGERSRVFIARALLQNADLVILDESFAALDPENLRTALECTLDRAETLMVIAHP
ncbi:MAG TPA: ATP-binding cassette domain-containing protein [Bryobacteraceae bacterium]|jgi:ATP-binding cassette subfamily B protein|nr:ATP-binding cassette domain-containing protein [Bryobacteraceae bacterium]